MRTASPGAPFFISDPIFGAGQLIPVLEGETVRLRGGAWADFAPFAAMWQEPQVARHIPFGPVRIMARRRG